jgi:hypothetical protein
MKDLKPHPHADILRAIADGKQMRMRIGSNFEDVTGDEALTYMLSNQDISVKPETITINGHEVPCPVREPLEYQDGYYVPCVSNKERFVILSWRPSCGDDSRLLSLGLIHLTPEAAIAHTEALLSFTRIGK